MWFKAVSRNALLHSSFYTLPSLRLLTRKVPSTRSCSPRACRVWTSITASASQVRLIQGCEVHIYLIRFGGQPHVLPHSSSSPFFFPSLVSPLLPPPPTPPHLSNCFRFTQANFRPRKRQRSRTTTAHKERTHHITHTQTASDVVSLYVHPFQST